jgi:hypothetical protein
VNGPGTPRAFAFDMATRAERAKTEAQKTGRGGRRSLKKAPKSEWGRDKAHAGSKATHALEKAGGVRPSRESTRKSANRAKADAAMNITEEVRRGAPAQLARKARARASHVRGS